MRYMIALLAGILWAGSAWGQAPAKAAASPSPSPETLLGSEVQRWFDIDAWNLTTRYRYVRANSGAVLADQQQWQTIFRPRLKFDAKGKYSVAAVISTGNNFTGGFNNVGPGTGRGQTNLFVKQLYFDAKPSKKVEVQFGGLDINRGESTEVVTYDNDAYITGERLIVRAPKTLWFDEISATNAYLGDLNHPSIFGRLHRLDSANYHQFLVRKQVTKAVGVSTDYTFLGGSDTFREAVRIKPKNFFLDLILIEGYERVSAPRGSGIDLFAAKLLHPRFTLSGGFTRLDRRLTLNADRFPPGKRIYVAGIYTITPELTLTTFLIQGVGRLPTVATPRTRLDVLLTWNVMQTLHRHHVL